MPLQSSSFSSEVSTHIKALFYEFELKTELSNQKKKKMLVTVRSGRPLRLLLYSNNTCTQITDATLLTSEAGTHQRYCDTYHNAPYNG